MFLLRLRKLSQIILSPSLLSALFKGAVAGMEHLLILRDLDCGYILDIGANRGQFALAAREALPNARIHSFEPLTEPGQIFKRIFANDPCVTLHPFAVGKEKKCSTIHITKDDDSSSLMPVTKLQSDLFPGAVETRLRQVMVYPLSQVIESVSIPPDSLLKIDVQGYELDVLQGCENLLQRFSYLYIECSFVELYEGQALAYQIIAWLEERGFVLCSVHNLYYGRDSMAIQGDFLFSKKKMNGNAAESL